MIDRAGRVHRHQRCSEYAHANKAGYNAWAISYGGDDQYRKRDHTGQQADTVRDAVRDFFTRRAFAMGGRRQWFRGHVIARLFQECLGDRMQLHVRRALVNRADLGVTKKFLSRIIFRVAVAAEQFERE